MIIIKNNDEIEQMKTACRITGETLCVAHEAIREGMSTKELDDIIKGYINKCGAKPTFLGYGGFPGSACISVNEQVIHGIPSKTKILHEGDIVKIDVGAFKNGFTGDSAATFPVGKISAEAQELIDTTRNSFYKGIEQINTDGARLGDVGSAVEAEAEKHGFSVVRRYTGHGVGRELHEDPAVPNYGRPGHGIRLCRGMTLAIEPMVCVGRPEVIETENGWTVVTTDGKQIGRASCRERV